MEFKILTIQENKKEWSELIANLNPGVKDLHFLPEYGEIYQKTYGYITFLAFYGNKDEYVIQPFVKRKLNDLPFLRGKKENNYFDIASPYGYGGPVYFGPEEKLTQIYKKFNQFFNQYCQKEKIASEFTSLHPILANHKITDKSLFKINRQKEIVYCDLTQSQEKLWRRISKGHRSDINKARRHKVEVRKMPLLRENFSVFNRMYYTTMKRRQAAERWFFPEDYFLNCAQCLGKKRVSLFFTYAQGKIASTNLLIHDFTICYHLFGASDPKFYSLRTNSLTMWEMFCFARMTGYKYFHLGGGVSDSPDDSLFRFKAGFSDLKKNLYTYFRIHHRPTYNYLCDLKREYEIRTLGREIKSDYLPLYRR